MFEKLVSFTKKVADLPDRPSINSSELKAQFDAAPDEVRTYLNKLIDALTKTTTGDSGAKNIGATSITGLTGTDVQSLIESLKDVAILGRGGVRVEEFEISFVSNGTSDTLTGSFTYSKPFTFWPTVLPGQIINAVPYGNTILHPYMQTTESQVTVSLIIGSSTAKFGAGTMIMKFIAIGK